MKRKTLPALFFSILFVGIAGFGCEKSVSDKTKEAECHNCEKGVNDKSQEVECPRCPYKVGDPVDSLNGVTVYYNGHVPNVSGRNLTADNYNLGLKYQCVEFVKRYYYEFYGHKMPDPWGHAIDFFDPLLEDGQRSTRRDLVQYRNPSRSRPKVGDLVVFVGTYAGGYGHVAIVSDVKEDEIEIIQQNPGPYESSRVKFSLKHHNETWRIGAGILGWLRKE